MLKLLCSENTLALNIVNGGCLEIGFGSEIWCGFETNADCCNVLMAVGVDRVVLLCATQSPFKDEPGSSNMCLQRAPTPNEDIKIQTND